MLATAHPVCAQVTAQVTPVKYNLTVKPGEPTGRDVSVMNQGTNPVIVRVRLSDWTLSPEGQLALAPLGSTANTLDSLVQFEPAEFSLGPGEAGLVHVTLRLPLGGPATRWGVLLSEVRPAVPRPAALGPRAIAELGTTLYLSRTPADLIRADVIGMSADPLGGDSLSIAVRIRNAGERHFYVRGDLVLSDSTGARVQDGSFGTGVVLPGGERSFAWTCHTAWKPGRYTVTASMDTGEPDLMVAEATFQWPPRGPSQVPIAEGSPH